MGPIQDVIPGFCADDCADERTLAFRKFMYQNGFEEARHFLAQDMIALQNEPEKFLHYSAEALAYVEHTAWRILLDATAKTGRMTGFFRPPLDQGHIGNHRTQN